MLLRAQKRLEWVKEKCCVEERCCLERRRFVCCGSIARHAPCLNNQTCFLTILLLAA